MEEGEKAPETETEYDFTSKGGKFRQRKTMTLDPLGNWLLVA